MIRITLHGLINLAFLLLEQGTHLLLTCLPHTLFSNTVSNFRLADDQNINNSGKRAHKKACSNKSKKIVIQIICLPSPIKLKSSKRSRCIHKTLSIAYFIASKIRALKNIDQEYLIQITAKQSSVSIFIALKVQSGVCGDEACARADPRVPKSNLRKHFCLNEPEVNINRNLVVTANPSRVTKINLRSVYK